MALFSKRLTCFYCGRRASRPVRGQVRKFHCEHCEADNYLDENGDIADPPAEDTNRLNQGPDSSSPALESTEFAGSNSFCSTCIRNQHLFRSSLAAYFPPSDDPTDAEYERGYAQFKKGLEERYPQVCDACGPRVLEEIRKKGYEAKADHLQRMMDRSRASKTLRKARDRSWQSLLVYAGALGYWTSVGGQLAWDVMSIITSPGSSFDTDMSSDTPVSMLSCVSQTVQMGRLPSECSFDLASIAGFALIAGLFSIWWNPKLRMKVEGRTGRFAGFAGYYQTQLITLVARCVFWELLKDPTASALGPSLPPALHMFMIGLMLLSVVASRRIVDYNTQPLVDWSDNSWEKPLRSGGASPISGSSPSRGSTTPRLVDSQLNQRFPLEKLAPRLPSARPPPAFPTPPPEVDEMEWTPSAAQPVLQPKVSVRQERPSVPDGPSPFTGSLPPAPKPPAWNLRNQLSVKPIEQVVQPNPFHRGLPNPQHQWQPKASSPEPVFRPPSFFPTSDLNTSTGLETLFERAFDIDPESSKRDWKQPSPNQKSYSPPSRQILFQCLRLALLLGSMAAWTLSQNHQLSIRGNYIEACALGSASLIAGFALLEAVKSPLVHWNGKEILFYITELAAAVHLGAHLPQASYEREYFDRYGKMLLFFMAAQEGLGVVASYKEASVPADSEQSKAQSPMPPPPVSAQPASPHLSPSAQQALSWSPTHSTFGSPPPAASVTSHSEAPSLSFSTTTVSSSFSSGLSSALPGSAPNYRVASSQSHNHYPAAQKNPHSFTMSDLQVNDPPSDYDRDSDTDTVATATTTMTDATTRNIRYGRPLNSEFESVYSPRRSELGPGIDGLSLEDRPTSRRVTRSQTQRGLKGRRFLGRAV